MPDRLEQTVPVRPLEVEDIDKRLVDEAAHQIEDVGFFDTAHSLRGLERPTSGEHRQLSKQRFLWLRKELIAPIHRCVEGGVPPPVSPARSDQSVLFIQSSQHLIRGQQICPRGRKFDRQGQAVEATGELRHRRGVLGTEPELWLNLGGTLDKEPDSLSVTALDRLFRWKTQGWDRIDDLAGNSEKLTAGGQDPELGTPRQHGLRQGGSGLENMFTVVEHQEEFFVDQVVAQYVNEHPPAVSLLVPDPERHSRLVDDQARVGHRGQFHNPGSVLERVDDLCDRLEREPRFSCPTNPGECDESGFGEELSDQPELLGTADEARELHRQVVGMAVQAGQGREFGRKPGPEDLVYVLRPSQVS